MRFMAVAFRVSHVVSSMTDVDLVAHIVPVRHDPLYQIRGLPRHGVEHLTERQQAKITTCLDAGDPQTR